MKISQLFYMTKFVTLQFPILVSMVFIGRLIESAFFFLFSRQNDENPEFSTPVRWNSLSLLVWSRKFRIFNAPNQPNSLFFRTQSVKFAIFTSTIGEILSFYVPNEQNLRFLCNRSMKSVIFMYTMDEICGHYIDDRRNLLSFKR